MAEPAIVNFADIEPGIILQWKAFELRPHPVPTLDLNGEYLTRIWQEHVYPMAEKMGFAMKFPSVQPRTRLAHAAAKWAADHGKFNAFNHALFRAFFQDDHDIGKLEILMQIAEKIGLNSNDLESGSQMDFYVQKVLHDEEMALQANVRAVPAYVSNNKVLATGVQNLLQLQQLIPLG